MLIFGETFWNLYKYKDSPHENPDNRLKWGGFVQRFGNLYQISTLGLDLLSQAQTKEIEELDIDWKYLEPFIPIFIKCDLKSYTCNDPWFQEWFWANILEIDKGSPSIGNRGRDLISQYFTHCPHKALELLTDAYRRHQKNSNYHKIVKRILKPEWPYLLSQLPPDTASYWANFIRKT